MWSMLFILNKLPVQHQVLVHHNTTINTSQQMLNWHRGSRMGVTSHALYMPTWKHETGYQTATSSLHWNQNIN